MAASKGLTPGTSAPASGQYLLTGPRGGNGGSEITSIQGRPLPPTDRPGQTWTLVDPTKNGAGKVK